MRSLAAPSLAPLRPHGLRSLSSVRTATRIASVKRAGAKRNRRVVVLVDGDKRPKRTVHPFNARAQRTAGVTAAGMIGACVIAAHQRVRGIPASTRSHVCDSETPTR